MSSWDEETAEETVESEGERAGEGYVESTRRRTLLKTTGASAVAATTWLAGCNGPQTRRYEAAPVKLADEARERGYALSGSDTIEVTRTEEAGDLTLEVTLVSHTASYDRSGDEFVQTPRVGLASTPQASEAGVALNPIASAPIRELLTRDVGQAFLRQLDIGQTWDRGPEQVGSGQGTLLGTDVEVQAFAGVADGDFVLLHAARVEHEGDAVLAGEARTKPAEDPDTPFVASDGYITQETVDESAGRFVDMLPLVVHGEAPEPGTPPGTDEPTATEEPTARPNLVRLHPVQIDGLAYGEAGEPVPEGFAPEWGDAHAEAVDLVAVGGDSAMEGQLFTKFVSGRLQIGLYLPSEEAERVGVTPDEFAGFRIQLDTTGSGELSDGDVRLTGRPVAADSGGAEERPGAEQEDGGGVEAMRIGLSVFRDGEFAEVTPDEEETGPGPGTAMAGLASGGGFSLEGEVNFDDLQERLEVNLDEDDGEVNFNLDIDAAGTRYGVDIDPEEVYGGYNFGGTFLPPDVPEIPPRDNSSVGRLEVTQAVQDSNNSLRLAADKETLARVFVSHPASSSITVDVQLSASSCQGGCWTHLGQLSKTFQAPPTPLDREEYDHSANFELPADWRSKDRLRLTAYVSRPGHIYLGSLPRWQTVRVDFQQTFDPNITLIRVNEGSTSSPNRPSTRTSYLVQKGFERVMPVGSVFFHTPGAGMLGSISPSDNLIKELDKLAQQIASSSTITIPIEQVFGLTHEPPSGYSGGLSDPTWGGSPGNCTAAWGALKSTSRELVMAHEVNHNIGGKEWAKHIAGGCGSGGGDSGNSSRDVGEVGWNPAYNSMVPTNHPELMTYCSDKNPRKWIGSYRWDHLMDRWKNYNTGVPTHPDYQSSSNPSLSTVGSKPAVAEQYAVGDPAALPDGGDFYGGEGDGGDGTVEGGAGDDPAGDADPLAERNWAAQSGTVRVISGSLFPDGSAELDPSFEVPGSTEEPDSGAEDPDAILQVRYESRALEVGITASFEAIERDQEVTESSFVVTVPDDGRITGIALLDAEPEEPLDGYEATDFELLEAGVRTPDRFARGELYDLDAFAQADTDEETTLHRKLFYSPDGEMLFPYGRRFTDDTVQVRFTEEPGGEAARFVLAVSDGVRTELVESDSFAVDPQPPRVEIDRANRWVGEYESTEGDDQQDRERNSPGDAEADANLAAIRNVAGPVETVAGGVVSLRAKGQTERWTVLDGSDLRWSITDDDGERVRVVGSAVGTRVLHRFDTPGRYTVTVTGRDPKTGLTASDEIDVVVEQPALPDAELAEAFASGGG